MRTFPSYSMIAAGALMVAGCCRTEGRPFPEHYAFGLDYVLRVTQIAVDGSPLPLKQRATARGLGSACGERDAIKVCVGPSGENIDVALVNNSSGDIAVRWNDGAFVDETGLAHPLEAVARGTSPPHTLIFPDKMMEVPSNGAAADSVWPKGKVYYASVNCKNAYIMYEPLIPGTLNGNRLLDRAAVENALAKQTPVFLTFPLMAGGKMWDVRVEMLLVTREEAYRDFLASQKAQR